MLVSARLSPTCSPEPTEAQRDTSQFKHSGGSSSSRSHGKALAFLQLSSYFISACFLMLALEAKINSVNLPKLSAPPRLPAAARSRGRQGEHPGAGPGAGSAAKAVASHPLAASITLQCCSFSLGRYNLQKPPGTAPLQGAHVHLEQESFTTTPWNEAMFPLSCLLPLCSSPSSPR